MNNKVDNCKWCDYKPTEYDEVLWTIGLLNPIFLCDACYEIYLKLRKKASLNSLISDKTKIIDYERIAFKAINIIGRIVQEAVHHRHDYMMDYPRRLMGGLWRTIDLAEKESLELLKLIDQDRDLCPGCQGPRANMIGDDGGHFICKNCEYCNSCGPKK